MSVWFPIPTRSIYSENKKQYWSSKENWPLMPYNVDLTFDQGIKAKAEMTNIASDPRGSIIQL